MQQLGDESSCGDARSVGGEDMSDCTATELAEGGAGGFYLSLGPQPVFGPSGRRKATATTTPQEANLRPSI